MLLTRQNKAPYVIDAVELSRLVNRVIPAWFIKKFGDASLFHSFSSASYLPYLDSGEADSPHYRASFSDRFVVKTDIDDYFFSLAITINVRANLDESHGVSGYGYVVGGHEVEIILCNNAESKKRYIWATFQRDKDSDAKAEAIMRRLSTMKEPLTFSEFEALLEENKVEFDGLCNLSG